MATIDWTNTYAQRKLAHTMASEWVEYAEIIAEALDMSHSPDTKAQRKASVQTAAPQVAELLSMLTQFRDSVDPIKPDHTESGRS